ncbi:MAG TPA: TIGR03842 family LLM class F420-dependent oxidoreductase [Solirubrobacteraceae bacterium]|nr:TIGR03842 family LLM class F420-dependent oxidoreductase [Solirubrobacteraceae bacterium]
MDFGVTILPDPPAGRFVELVRIAEQAGFTHAWTYDSHVLWQDGYAFLALAGAQTTQIRLGHCVTNPGIRDPTVTASAYATLHDITGERMVMGIGRGDSSRRVVGLDPVPVAEFERALAMIKELMNGRPARWNGQELQLAWAQGRSEIPMYVAGYGPRALAVAGRVGDGVIIQLADPEITAWIMARAEQAAAAVGRAGAALAPIVCAPAVIGDRGRGRDAVRWFPAMVSNHVKDIIARHGAAAGVPAALLDYAAAVASYSYAEHSRIGAGHGQYISDEICDRFCVLGSIEEHIEQLRELAALGVQQFNIYLMTGEQEATLAAYGEHIIPALSAG